MAAMYAVAIASHDAQHARCQEAALELTTIAQTDGFCTHASGLSLTTVAEAEEGL